MKIGKLEGTPEEIRDLIADNGLNIEDYLERHPTPFRRIWFWPPSILFVASIFWLTVFPPASSGLGTFIFLMGLLGGAWLALTIKLRFGDQWGASFFATATILILLIAFGVIIPGDIAEILKGSNNRLD